MSRASASATAPAASSTRAARSFELMARPALKSNPVALNSNPVACHLPYRRVRQMPLSQRGSWPVVALRVFLPRRRWRRGSCHTAGRAASADGDAIAETATFENRDTNPHKEASAGNPAISSHAATNPAYCGTCAGGHRQLWPSRQLTRTHRQHSHRRLAACACGVGGVMWRAHTLDDTRGAVYARNPKCEN